MKQSIGCDAHKGFCVFAVMKENGGYEPVEQVSCERTAMRAYLEKLPAESEIALEAGGTYYWLVDEIKAAGHHAHLAHPTQAKQRMMGRNKTDAADARGLAMLLRNQTLPEVWIPSPELRDQRAMLRLRMNLVAIRSGLKNRIQGSLAQYNVRCGSRDVFGEAGLHELSRRLQELPPWTSETIMQQLATIGTLDTQIGWCEKRLAAILQNSAERDLLRTLPCVGPILSAVIAMETGEVSRFDNSGHYASYAGLVPRMNETGGRTGRQRSCPSDCNQYLKWAFIEAANLVAAKQKIWAGEHVVELYQRIKRQSRKHAVAAVAVARHLAEAAFSVLRKGQTYRAPQRKHSVPALSTTHG